MIFMKDSSNKKYIKKEFIAKCHISRPDPFILFFLIFSFFFFNLFSQGTRKYLKTGNWYPHSKSELNSMLENFLGETKLKNFPGRIRGIIAPHAGFAYSGKCASKAYKQLENLSNIHRVIILGVSHRAYFYGACVSDFLYNATPLGKIPVDREIIKRLSKEKFFRTDSNIMQYEHSIENQLPFLQKVFKGKKFKIVPILFGQLNRKDFKLISDIIRKYVDKKSIVIASSDFTHYGQAFDYVPFKTNVRERLTKLDMGIINRILNMDFNGYFKYKQRTGITMCGFVPVGIMMKIFSGEKIENKLMSYYKSGDAENKYNLSVSYASIVFFEKKKGLKVNKKSFLSLSLKEKQVLISMARKTLEMYYKKKDYLTNIEKRDKLTENLRKKTGVFVTLREKGELRGCIGSIVGIKPLYQGVMENVINAAYRDPRFVPVKKKELDIIDIEISVMTPLKKIRDYKKIRLGIDGVIIKKGYNQAVYLPQVAKETGWDIDEFLSHLCRKAGLRNNAYKSKDMEFYIFQAIVFDETVNKK